MKNFNTQYPIPNTQYRKARKAFTLMELLIYSGILVVSAGLIGGIVYTISKANLRTQVNEELNNQLILFEEVFRQKIQIAKGINSISGSLLSLEMSDANKNPTVFTLTNNVSYIKEGSGSQVALNNSDKVKVTSLSFTPTGPERVSISSTHHYAWNDQVGWIDFAYPGGNVQVPTGAGELKGLAYVLSDSHWISLNCISTDSCSTVDYKATSSADGILSGWAWSENFGWISFNCLSDDSCDSFDYAVTVATSTTDQYEAGEFDGYAWSENIGWVSFNCKTGGANKADICLTSDYRVQDLRLRTSAVKVDITLQYNSEKPELAVSRTNTFVFNLITPIK
jgi:hypothetical protein